MRMNRRNVLVGLGTIVAGGGAALGTGAFSSVEATRSVELQTSGDSDALLQFTSASEIASDNGGTNSNELVFDQSDINEEAVTTFNPAFKVHNTGQDNVGFYVKSATNIGSDSILDFQDGSENSIVQSSDTDGNQIDLPTSATSATNVAVVVDTTAGDLSDVSPVTLVASTDAYQADQA